MQQTIKLGNLTLPRTAGLAPMAGVADRAYRILCKAVRQRTGFHGKSGSNCPALSAGLD